MTISEAREIIAAAKDLNMFENQKANLEKILETVDGIIKDLDDAHSKQTKKQGQTTNIIKNSTEYEISNDFRKHMQSLSRLVDAKGWTSTLLDQVNIEESSADEYIRITVGQADCFVEGLRNDVCNQIADVALDGETKQWISTVVGFFIDLVLLVLYGLIIFKVGIFYKINITDAIAGFIGAVASVLTFAITSIVCTFINRWLIHKFDENHNIKYRELVRASSRSDFEKSILLMSFSEDFDKLKNDNRQLIENTNKLLEYSLNSEKMQKEIGQKLVILEEQNKNLLKQIDTLSEKASKERAVLKSTIEKQTTEIKSLHNELDMAHVEATKERQQFHNEASEQAKDHQRELEKASKTISEQRGEIVRLKDEASRLRDNITKAHAEATKERQQFHNEASEQAKGHQRELKKTETIIELQKIEIDSLNKKVDELTNEQKTSHSEMSKKLDTISKGKNKSWKCRVCYSENGLDRNECSVCGASMSIADSQIDVMRKEHEPEFSDGEYWCKDVFVCLPKNYSSQLKLRFSDRLIIRDKIILVPKDIAKIDFKDLWPDEDDENIHKKVITFRLESNKTKILGSEQYKVERNPYESK